jgi:CHAD domain-containing protein
MPAIDLVRLLSSSDALTWASDAPSSDADAIGAVLSAALDGSYQVVPHDVSRLSLTHLDTVDGRVQRAGAGAVHADTKHTLFAIRPDHEPIAQAIARVRWPALLEALPDGPVRAALSRPVWVRALIPYATTRSTARTFAVLNEDEKTVARITWWNSTLGPDGPELPPRLYVRELRGYGKDGKAVRRLLFKNVPVVQDGSTWFDSVPRPDAAAERERSTIAAGQPAATAVAAALLNYLDDIEANVPGVLDDVDTEFLHDLRVAVRRTRSVLKIVGDVLPADTVARAVDEFRRLGTITTPTRDLDVYLLGMDAMAASIANPSDLVPFGEHLRRRRTEARRALARELRSPRFADLCAWWRKELAEVIAAPGRKRPSAAELADRRLHKLFGKVTRMARAIDARSEAADVHALRKRCKEMRYLLEVFEPICNRHAYKQVIADFKELQNVLGEFQDGEVQALALRVFAQEMIDSGSVHASAVLAMGDLAGRFDARQRQARSELTERHDTYLGKSAAQHVDRLIPA